MISLDRWFRSGRYSLLSHANLPEKDCEPLGVVMAPPLGWEDVCSYRPLRFLARQLARNGFPVLRFDLPGTGDSSGDALDPGLFDAWVQSVQDAAAELRAIAGLDQIAVAGVRLGAMLALIAAARGGGFTDLILWSPAATGRGLLRELRAFAGVQLGEYGRGQDAPPQPAPGFEVGGFLISSETQHALEAVDLSSLPPMTGTRALILPRDDLPADAKLLRALHSAGCDAQVRPGRGYAAMMAIPHEAVPPQDTGCEIVQFLRARPSAKTRDMQPPAARVAIADQGGGVFETIYTLSQSGVRMFGILSEPAAKAQRSKWCALFLNPGATRHIGPNRMWVEAARRWAARGLVSLRLDLAGIGESDGDTVLDVERLYQDSLVDQVELALDTLRARLGIHQFIAIGLCSGAFWGLHAAVRDADVRAAVLLNPRLFQWDPEVDRLRALRRTVKGLTSFADWRRIARGEVSAADIKRMAMEGLRARHARSDRPFEMQMEALDRARRALERNHSRATIIFTEGEPLLNEMEDLGKLPPETDPCIRAIRIPNGGHTFRPLWIQKLGHELIDAEIGNAIHQVPECVTESRG
ncbi:MAG TPA: alpha/beta fold hydrolase [Bryobacteraceae bacterium]|nr:alpha/beta fold hydrolase [Bryobacteraceae bacterium]